MFLTYILPILLFAYRVGHAFPVYGTLPSSTTILPLLAVIDVNAPPPRTLLGVAWSCILTVFICAWTAVHPNVPPRGVMGGLLARVKLMFWTIVAPELMLAWAVRQWFAAKEIRDIYNRQTGIRRSRRWTMNHGHFLQMGGFTLVSGKIHQFKDTEEPEWLATPVDWDTYNESVKQRKRCQLGPLTFERFKELVGDPNVVFPAITSAEIRDRSKGDGLSKLLAILQTSWFILQCIARGVQGLALTELELVTLAMASLNALTFAFWWSKPLSVQEPVNVYIRERAAVAEKVSHAGLADYEVPERRGAGWSVSFFVTATFHPQQYPIFQSDFTVGRYLVVLPFALLWIMTFPLFSLFRGAISFLLSIIKTENVEKAQDDDTVATRVVLSLGRLRYRVTHSIRRDFGSEHGALHAFRRFDFAHFPFFMHWFVTTPAYLLLLVLLLLTLSPLFAIFFFASFTFTFAFEIVTTNKVRPGAHHVPPFYAPRTKSDNYSRMIVFAIFGGIFGGIHCIAWNFIFPTHAERSFWRYTSLVLTAIPLVVAPIDCILENVKLNGKVGKKFRLLLAIFMTALLFLYVPARLSLIAQALALLREQPPSAYVAVNWTKYIPHLFN